MSATPRVRATEGIEGRDAVGLYLESIAKIGLLTAVEEVELSKKIEVGLYAEHLKSGELTSNISYTDDELDQIIEDGQAALKRFVSANLRLVVSVARKYGRAAMPLLDLIQEGNTGLIRAVEKFDYAKGFKFSTYATWWIRQSITRGVAQQARIVRLPVHVAEQVTQVSATRRNLERTLGREPELIEIADELGLELDRVIELFRLARDHVSLDAPVETDGDTSLGELMVFPAAPGLDDVVVDAEERGRLEAMLGTLDERAADVVRRRYGLLDGRQAKLADIGAVWGITAERVRQIERQAISQLRKQQTLAA